MREAVDKARLMFSYRGEGQDAPDADERGEKGRSKHKFRSRGKKKKGRKISVIC